MNSLHRALFHLLCEFDDICRKNEITYYLHAGSVIGARRHNGFIPWDDDVDIAITRKNWEKLKKILINNPRANRELVSYENYSDYSFPYPQYRRTDDTTIFASSAYYSFPRGSFIDIMILDPVKDDERVKKRHVENLKILSQMLCQRYVINRSCNRRKYNLYQYLGKIVGREKVLQYLVAQLEKGNEEECDGYIQRVGAFPTFWDKKFFNEPEYLKIEGRLFPVPTHTDEYLRYTYGDIWMKFPPNIATEGHGFKYSDSFPYKAFFDDCQVDINKQNFEQAWHKYKYWKLKAIPYEDAVNRYKSIQIAEIASIVVEKQLSGEELIKKLKQFEFLQLEEKLEYYISTQLLKELLQNAIPIKAKEEVFYTACMLLILRGDYDKAAQIVNCGKGLWESSKYFAEVQEAIEKSRALSIAFFEEKCNKKLISDLVDEASSLYPHHADFAAAKCIMIACGKMEGTAQNIVDICNAELSFHPSHHMLKSCLAEAWLRLGLRDDAVSLFCKIYSETNNGILRLKIEKTAKENGFVLLDNSPVGKEQKRELLSSSNQVQQVIFSLLNDFDSICKKEGIPYFLGGYLAAQAVKTNDFYCNCCSSDVIVHPADRKHLIKALEKHKLPNRTWESFENNRYFPDFSLKYCDTNTTLVDLREVGFYRNQAVSINVYFVRPYENKSLIRKFNTGLYATIEALAFPTVFFNQSRKKIIAGCMGRFIAALIGKKNLKRIVWHLIYHRLCDKTEIKGSIKNYWNKKIDLPSIDFSLYHEVTLRNRSFPIPVNYDEYILPQISSAFFEERLSFSRDYWQIADINANCEDYHHRTSSPSGRIRFFYTLRKLQLYNTTCARHSSYTVYSWNIIRCFFDRYEMYKHYMPMKQALLLAYKKGNYRFLEEKLEAYINVLKENIQRRKTVVFDTDIFLITCNLLEKSGQDDLVKSLIANIIPSHFNKIQVSFGRISGMKMSESTDKERIISYLSNDQANCLYMYADIFKYGVKGANISVWYDTDELGIRMVVMKYHQNFQVYSNRAFDKVDGLLDLIEKENPMGISGRKEIIRTLAGKLSHEYNSTYGAVFRGKPLDREKLLSRMQECPMNIEAATVEDVPEIAELLCMDSEFGSVYTQESLAEEFKDRLLTKMGRNYIIREKDKIVAHNATYAECEDFVVVSGLMVHPDYRDTECAYWIDIKSSIEFQLEGKERYFLAIKPKIIKWNKFIGNILVAEYGKLSLIKKDIGCEGRVGSVGI